MTLEELRAERAALEAAIDERQRQIDRDRTLASCAERDEPRRYVDYTRNAQPARTRSAPAPQRSGNPFTPAEMKLLEPLTAAIGEMFKEERRARTESAAAIREELQEFVRREVDRMCQRLRNEALQDRLDVERQWRAAEQERRHQGSLRVSEMIEINPNDVN